MRNNKAVHELVKDMIFIKIIDINICLCGCRGLKVDKVIIDDSLKTLIQNNSSFIDEIIIPMVNTPRIRFTDNTILRY